MYWKRLGGLILILCVFMFLGCSDDDTSDRMVEPAESAVEANEDGLPPLAPGFTLLDTELEEVSLADYQNQVVLLDFWATWCKPCEDEIPLFIELYEEYREQGFEMIGISLDEAGLEVVEPFIERLGINYTILLAVPGIVQKYNVPGIPSAFLINREGRIVKVFDGAQEKKETYESELKKLL